MAKVELPFLYRKKVRRRGRVYTYYYFRRDGLLIRLPSPDDPSFSQKYTDCLNTPKREDELPFSMAALIKSYRQSPEFKKLSEKTRLNKEVYLNAILEEHGRKRADHLTQGRIYDIRDSMQATPGKANNYISCLSTLMRHAIRKDWRRDNPCAGVERLELGEHEPWPEEVIARAVEEADEMTRLAIALHYYTGQRIGDVCAMTYHDIKDGWIRVIQEKTGKELWIRLHEGLQAELARVERNSIHILSTSWRTPFKPHSLRNRLRALMKKIGENYRFHGLRKNAVNALLEAGCTTWETASITGQSPQMIEHYAKKVNRRILAAAAMDKWESGKTFGKTFSFPNRSMAEPTEK